MSRVVYQYSTEEVMSGRTGTKVPNCIVRINTVIFLLIAVLIIYGVHTGQQWGFRTFSFWMFRPKLLDEVKNDGRKSFNSSMSTRFFFFNVTNPGAVLEGQKPILTEVGPYYYEEMHTKVILHLDENVIIFRPKTDWLFRQAYSHGTEQDLITLPNLPYVTVSKLAKELGKSHPGLPPPANNPEDRLREPFFVSRTVKDCLTDGYSFENLLSTHFPAISQIETRIPQRFQDGRFGFLYKLNGTEDIWTISVNSEKEDFLTFQSYNGKTKLNIWGDESCDQVQGTYGMHFPPGADKESVITVFVPLLCRSFKISYRDEVEFEKITSMRFGFHPNTFGNLSSLSENYCYCKGYVDNCVRGGVLPMEKCFGGAPVFLSQPHFKDADPYYVNGVEGLNPQAKMRDFNSYFYLDEIYGSLLGSTVRLQLNAELQPHPLPKESVKLPSIMMPLLWIEHSHLESERFLKYIRTKGGTGDWASTALVWCIDLTVALILLSVFRYVNPLIVT